jgi:hypothetical protein
LTLNWVLAARLWTLPFGLWGRQHLPLLGAKAPVPPSAGAIGFVSTAQTGGFVATQWAADGWRRSLPAGVSCAPMHTWSQSFSKHIKQLGFSGRKGAAFATHSFMDVLRVGGAAKDLSDALTGHSGGSVGWA